MAPATLVFDSGLQQALSILFMLGLFMRGLFMLGLFVMADTFPVWRSRTPIGATC